MPFSTLSKIEKVSFLEKKKMQIYILPTYISDDDNDVCQVKLCLELMQKVLLVVSPYKHTHIRRKKRLHLVYKCQ